LYSTNAIAIEYIERESEAQRREGQRARGEQPSNIKIAKGMGTDFFFFFFHSFLPDASLSSLFFLSFILLFAYIHLSIEGVM
jgi:hypothetical protein